VTWAEFQHSVVYYTTERCRKRLEECINAEGRHFEHHNRFFSEPPTTTQNWLFSEPPMSERTQQTFTSQVSVVIFSGAVDYSLFSCEMT